MTEHDQFPSETLARQIRAEEALILGNPEPRMEMWSRRDPVTLLSAGGERLSGWQAISGFFRQLASRFSNGSGFRFDVDVAEVSGDLAYTVGLERYDVSIAGGPVKQIAIRVTHIYRRESGEWKIVHRHGDAARLDREASTD
jgi:ketosteroid isomerase-like protein